MTERRAAYTAASSKRQNTRMSVHIRDSSAVDVGGMSAESLAALQTAKKRKYHNVPTTLDGITFDSKREAERYAELRLLEQAGEISALEIHPSFPLVVHGQDCGRYEGDFAYLDADGSRHVEDVKSAATRKLPTYRLKKRMVWAIYGLTVEEK